MEQPEFAKWWILLVCQKGKPHSALVNKGLWKLRNKMMNVQYMIIVLQVNVGWSVVLCVIQLVLFEEGISSLLRVISRVGNHSLSQKKKCSIDILSLSLSHKFSYFQQTIKNIWRAILKYQGILNANNKVISITAPAQKAKSIIISSETSSASFDVSIFSSFSKCYSVTKTTVHSLTLFYLTRQKLDPRRS